MVTVPAQPPRAAVQANAFPVQMCREQTAEGPAGPPSGKPSLQPAWRFPSQSPQKVGGNDSFASYLWISHQVWKGKVQQDSCLGYCLELTNTLNCDRLSATPWSWSSSCEEHFVKPPTCRGICSTVTAGTSAPWFPHLFTKTEQGKLYPSDCLPLYL